MGEVLHDHPKCGGVALLRGEGEDPVEYRYHFGGVITPVVYRPCLACQRPIRGIAISFDDGSWRAYS